MTRSRDRRSAKKEIYYIACIVTVLLIVALGLFGPAGYRELRQARIELLIRKSRVDQLQRENEARKKNIEKLKTDRRAQERYAREKNYGREGELIQRLPKEPESPQQNRLRSQ